MNFSETTQNRVFAFIYSFLRREPIAFLRFSKGSTPEKVKNFWPGGRWNCDRVHECHNLQPQPQVRGAVALSLFSSLPLPREDGYPQGTLPSSGHPPARFAR